MDNHSMRNVDELVVSQASIVNLFMRGVYLWMFFGLLVTAGAAAFVLSNRSILTAILSSKFLFFGLIIAELAIVFIISGALNKLSSFAATSLFLLYSALNGCTLAPVLLAFTSASVAKTFLICAGMFGAMSLYGLITKKDLTSWGSFLFMGLIGILIAMAVNIFIQSTRMDMIVSAIGVLVFLGLTAYDTQKLRNMGLNAPHDDPTAIRRGTIFGALQLYLDFINLFLFLLRFAGDRR